MNEFNELRVSFEAGGNNRDPKDNMVINMANFVKENWNVDMQKMDQLILVR